MDKFVIFKDTVASSTEVIITAASDTKAITQVNSTGTRTTGTKTTGTTLTAITDMDTIVLMDITTVVMSLRMVLFDLM